MIPKIIHYCWFGGSLLPQAAQECIKSWKKYCPEYEIKEWNESNFDVTCCAYTEEAYRVKKWAFVSDYARFKILYEYGGVYFDTDVELLKPIDNLISLGPFMGREDNIINSYSVVHGLAANPGLGLAANPGLDLYKEILNVYENRHFIKDDGSNDYTTVVTITTEILKKYGLKNINEIQKVKGIYIYPKEYFCPKDFVTLALQITEKTYSIHHFDGSWLTDEDKFALKLSGIFKRLHIRIISSYLAKFIAAVKYRGIINAIKELVDWMKRINKKSHRNV